MDVAIYGIYDPRDEQIRYVGQTRNTTKRRLCEHRSCARQVGGGSHCSHLYKWLLGLDADGVVPEITILEMTPPEQADERERYWIGKLHDEGAPLLNTKGYQPSREALRWRERREQPDPIGEALRRQRAIAAAQPSASSEEIRAFREKWNLSQTQLARALGYHNASISLWESGKRTPPPGLRLRLDKLAQDLSGV